MPNQQVQATLDSAPDLRRSPSSVSVRCFWTLEGFSNRSGSRGSRRSSEGWRVDTSCAGDHTAWGSPDTPAPEPAAGPRFSPELPLILHA